MNKFKSLFNLVLVDVHYSGLDSGKAHTSTLCIINSEESLRKVCLYTILHLGK